MFRETGNDLNSATWVRQEYGQGTLVIRLCKQVFKANYNIHDGMSTRDPKFVSELEVDFRT